MRLPRRSACVFTGTVALALVASACRPAPAPPTGRDGLAAAVSTTLPFSARLSGGFAPSTQGPTRAAGDRPELSPDTRIAIALLEKRAIETPTPAALADLGVAYLIQGDVDRAIAVIEDAASQQTAAAPWSDLSAAYLVKAERTPARKIEYLARALEAAERSLKVARTTDALFNRALALDGLAPFTGTPAPWSEYSAAEQDQAWRAAASAEAGNDRPIEDSRNQWEVRRKQLPAKLAAGDTAFVAETVRLFPEGSIEFLDRVLLIDPAAGTSAAKLASAIHEVTGDPMLREQVAALRVGGARLAQVHQAYVRGAAQFDANDLSGARRSYSTALEGFSRAKAPYRAWAQFQLARIDWQDGHFEAAQRALSRVENEARTRGYTALLGRVRWQRGLVFNRQWRLTDGLAAFRESASLYDASGLREYAASVYSNLADALRMLGESNESWIYIGRTLENLRAIRTPNRRYLQLYNAALFAGRQNLHHAAWLFQEAAVREAGKAGPDVLTEATIQRALANIRRGDLVSARAAVEDADRRIASTDNAGFRAYATAELAIVRAQLGRVEDSAGSGLKDAIGFFSGTEPGRVPGLYLLMARTPQARDSYAIAEDALRAGIEALEAQQASLGEETLRISFFDESWTLFQDMVVLQAAAHDSSKVFEYAERSRARSLLATAQNTSLSTTRLLPDIQAQLPASVVLVHYTTLPDRVLVWTITSSGATLIERPIGARDLTRLIEQHRESVREHRENRAVNDHLHALLIAPISAALPKGAVLVLIPDGPLQQLPFATLREPASQRFLIEDHALLVSPSANFFVDARARAGTRSKSPIESALLIGNPTADGARALPGAEAEVAAASQLYQRHQTLTGPNATKGRFLESAPSFDVVHFGGHALANPEFPLLSRLVFAGEDDAEQSLFAHEIARVNFLKTRVVVLAACSTAGGAFSRGEGILGVARPFLGGGVPLVIASLWDVDDRSTEQLTLAFHRELTKSGDPIQALHAAQLAMLRSGDAVQARPESWGAFVAIGTAAR